MQNARSTITSRATVDERGTASSSGHHAPKLSLTIAYHPDLDRVGERALFDESAANGPLAMSRMEPRFAPPGSSQGTPLDDEHISRKPFFLHANPDGSVRIELGDSTTSISIAGQRITEARELSPRDVARGVVIVVGQRVVLLVHRSTILENVNNLGPSEAARELVGESDGLRRVLWDIQSVADLDLPVLLRGETGSGKELVARALHRSSNRREQPFVAVNLGAITPSLAIAELFGAEKGAFTGSVKRQVGYFEQAAGGTLFLDEIGEAPVELQVALLRALETGEVQTVGAAQPRKIDVRVVAATDADLENKVAAGAFRAPLLNRLSAYEIWIPPLRQRRDDIGRLFVRFLREEMASIDETGRLTLRSSDAKPWFPATIAALLVDYDWPGNIRQLRNVVRQLVIGNRGRSRAEMTPAVERLLSPQPAPLPQVRPEIPPKENVAKEPPPNDDASRANPARRKPADISEDELRKVLKECKWELNETAEKLGISRASMYNLNDRFKWFRVAGDLTEEEIRRCFQECAGDTACMAEKLEVSEKALRRRVREFGLT